MVNAKECTECGNVNDDNPGHDMCKTCSDWIVTEGSDEEESGTQ